MLNIKCRIHFFLNFISFARYTLTIINITQNINIILAGTLPQQQKPITAGRVRGVANPPERCTGRNAGSVCSLFFFCYKSAFLCNPQSQCPLVVYKRTLKSYIFKKTCNDLKIKNTTDHILNITTDHIFNID